MDMKKGLCLLLFLLFLFPFPVSGQDAVPTYDPFASGSFYEELVQEPAGINYGEMVLIPEGPFIMGTDDPNALPDSRPAHEVTLHEYWIDRFEVTNALYADCVAAKYCTAPKDLSGASRKNYFTDPNYADYPVIHVDYYQATAYCAWAGKRLPTEAEWEKAARGNEGFLYPWGNELPDRIPAQINQFQIGDTVRVDSFPEGVSPYGVYNMEGNVWEWTSDQYDSNFYSTGPDHDPTAFTGGNDYVIRGYSWAYPFSRYEITTRNSSYILNHSYDLGFRCAK
ncbi:MAG: formylglycine-generating enzyme family protein [Anaerolineaceae bacterium]|nr:formylglycine-generating enzyme family protein [Anaerolineaceae bacterium]